MAIQSSGAISISELATEFGGSAPHALSEYYRDAGLVPGNNTNVPTSGAVALTDFYGSVAALVLNVSSNQTAYNILNEVVSAFSYNASTDTTPIIVNVQSGVDIVGSSGNPGITTGALNAASDVTINVASGATVCGFDGAQGASGSSATGGNGTDAIKFAITSPTGTYEVSNSGTVGGGSGGGGGGGQSGGRQQLYSDKFGSYCDGATQYGSNGANGANGASCQAQNGSAGSAGTYGGGSASCNVRSPSAGGAGGTAGKAVNKNSHTVTISGSGTYHGATS